MLLPGIILQSVLIGGGFATGREIVEYGAKFGALGWVAGISVGVGFTLLAILTFEFARKKAAYDYRSLMKHLVGPLWYLYDVAYVVTAIIIIAVMASATGEILNTTLGLNYWVGVVAIILIVAFLNFRGSELIARFKTVGSVVLLTAYVVFSILVLSTVGSRSLEVLDSADTSFMSNDFSILSVIWTGILYVGYNLAVYPASFFAVKGLRARKESLIAGIVSGVLMTVPWFLTYFSVLAFYPQAEVLSASVPWLIILTDYGTTVVIIFGIVMGWTLVETATGINHALIERINGSYLELKGKEIKPQQRGLITLSVLILALVLAQFGIIDLIAKGYGAMAYVIIAIYALPMLVVGGKAFFRSK